jgi:hypothetical protein
MVVLVCNTSCNTSCDLVVMGAGFYGQLHIGSTSAVRRGQLHQSGELWRGCLSTSSRVLLPRVAYPCDLSIAAVELVKKRLGQQFCLQLRRYVSWFQQVKNSMTMVIVGFSFLNIVE